MPIAKESNFPQNECRASSNVTEWLVQSPSTTDVESRKRPKKDQLTISSEMETWLIGHQTKEDKDKYRNPFIPKQTQNNQPIKHSSRKEKPIRQDSSNTEEEAEEQPMKNKKHKKSHSKIIHEEYNRKGEPSSNSSFQINTTVGLNRHRPIETPNPRCEYI